MTDTAPAVQTVPAPVDTTPTPAVVPEVSDTTPAPAPAKTFTQAEVDAIVAKRVEREQRKLQRQQAPQAPAQVPATPPKLEDFPTPEAHAEAVAEHRADVKVQERDVVRQQ